VIGIEIKGIEKLTKALSKETIRQPLEAGIKKITLLLDRLIKQSTPRVTSRLAGSIHSEVHPLYGKVGTIVKYAPFVEFGHKQEVGRYVPAIGKRLVAPFVEARHVNPGSQIRVLGEGMFSYGSKLVMEKFPELMKEIGAAIQSKWNM